MAGARGALVLDGQLPVAVLVVYRSSATSRVIMVSGPRHL